MAVLLISAPYRMVRLQALLDPEKYPDSPATSCVRRCTGWATGAGSASASAGRRAKWSWLPNADSDFIFAIIGEELGLIGAVLVLILFGLLAYTGMRIARRNVDPFVKIVAGACTVWLVGQAAINIGYVVGLLPTTGLTLPMISAGGTSLVVTMIVFGLLANFARREPQAAAALHAKGPGPLLRFLGIGAVRADRRSSRPEAPAKRERERRPRRAAASRPTQEGRPGPRRRPSGRTAGRQRGRTGRASRTGQAAKPAAGQPVKRGKPAPAAESGRRSGRDAGSPPGARGRDPLARRQRRPDRSPGEVAGPPIVEPVGPVEPVTAGDPYPGVSVLLAGGGTAGHIEPALAVADALRDADPTVTITALGTERGLETTAGPGPGLRAAAGPGGAAAPQAVAGPARGCRPDAGRGAGHPGGDGRAGGRRGGRLRRLRRAARLPRRAQAGADRRARGQRQGRSGQQDRRPVRRRGRGCRRRLRADRRPGASASRCAASSAGSTGRRCATRPRRFFGLDPLAPTLLVFGGLPGRPAASTMRSAARPTTSAAADVGVLHAYGRKNTVDAAEIRTPAARPMSRCPTWTGWTSPTPPPTWCSPGPGR